MYEIEFYCNDRGDCPTEEFLDNLPPKAKAKAKAAAWLNLLEEKGPDLKRPYADLLNRNIRELRVSFSKLEIRILYFIHTKIIILTHGFFKKTQKTPIREIEQAGKYRTNWLRLPDNKNIKKTGSNICQGKREHLKVGLKKNSKKQTLKKLMKKKTLKPV